MFIDEIQEVLTIANWQGFTHPLLRGRGEYFRLGSDASTNIKAPHKVEGLAGKKVIQVAAGALHCLALTEDGEVSVTTIRPPHSIIQHRYKYMCSLRFSPSASVHFASS